MPRANWKPETRAEYNGRAIARYRFPLGVCSACGAPATDRHHIDGNPTNNDLSNVTGLCRRCHMAADGRLEKIRASDVGRKPFPPRPCASCSNPVLGPLRRGMCRHCYDIRRKHVRKSEPCAAFHEAKATR